MAKFNANKETPSEQQSSENASITETEQEISDILPGYKTIEDFIKVGFQSIVETTKLSNQLPSGRKWDFYTTFPTFESVMSSEGNRILGLISVLLQHQGISSNILRRDAEEKFDLIVEANDTVLDRVGCNLDELAGINKNPEPVLVEAVATTSRVVSGSWNKNRQVQGSTENSFSPKTVRLLAAKNILRPQAKFSEKIDNSSSPFVPKIKEKPNSLKPLAIQLEMTGSGESFSHPYEFELDHFRLPELYLQKKEPRLYRDLSETPLVLIEKEEDIAIMMEDLCKYGELAIDLEHHSYRTFLGLTCLMQISTRDTDYIVDTLSLRNKLSCLNDIFTNQKVVKVFHGADYDICWLQRDLGLYVVNMFDTHQAARILNFPHLSLAYLMTKYCHVKPDKRYQLADWRIRPLPEELVTYARQDTHYLLYIYDVISNELIDAANGNTNLLSSAFQRSTEICKKVYQKPIFTEDSYLELYQRNKKLFDNRQLYAFKELFRWRDKIAREADESYGYVLPNHMLFHIAEVLPREMQGILACCNPIPPLVRQHLQTLHQIILKSREQPVLKPIMEEQLMHRAPGLHISKVNLEGPLHCPHDLSRMQEFRDDLPTLLGSKKVSEESNSHMTATKPKVSIFESSESENEAEPEEPKLLKLKNLRFVSPYQQYKFVRPYVLEQEKIAAMEAAPTNIQEVAVEEEIKIVANDDRQSLGSLEQSSSKEISQKKDQSTKKAEKKKKKRKLQQVEDSDGPPKKTKKKMKTTEDNGSPHKKAKKGKQTNLEPFDYSKVDYSQFKSNNKPPVNNVLLQAQSKVKAKGKKKHTGKKNHLSFTYAKGH